MYPTLMEDSNGNEVLIRYQQGANANWANSSARITEIEDVRATAYYLNGNYSQPYYHTYVFTYNNDTPRHLTSITNTINTGENYTFSYASQTIASPFDGSGAAPVALLQTATVSNIGTYHQFSYNGSGELSQITLPYKGYLQYGYVTQTYPSGKRYRNVQNRNLSKDGGAPVGYTVTWNTPSADIPQYGYVSDPSGKSAKAWGFAGSGASMGLATAYSGSDWPSWVARTQNNYVWSQDAAGNSYISSNVTTADPGQTYQAQKQTNQTVDNYGNVTQVVYYNWGNLSTPYRTDNFTYLNSSAYTSRYIYNRMSSSPTATIQYDQGPLTSVSGMREWDSSVAGPRGNTTNIWGVSDYTQLTYDITGNMTSTNLNGVGSSVSTTAATNYAAPSQMTVGSLSETLSYSSFLGLTNETGPNGASVSLGYDANARPTSATSPFGAVTTTTYNDTASPPTIVTSVNGRWTRQTLDGLGRTILTETGYATTTVSQQETVYGPCGCSPLGKMIKQAVPHAPGATPAYTTYTYDSIGRTTSVVAPDGASTTYYAYQGNWAGTSDPAGHWKSYQLDTFGNITAVQEPSPSSGYYYTYYGYDYLGHLTDVNMPRPTGTQTRHFSYSGNLLTSATNPENGTVSYTYNSYNKVATRTDAKGQVVVYTYDLYARLTKVQRYPSGTNNLEDTCQQENYYYDSNPFDGAYSQNVLGRLAAVQYVGGNCGTTLTEMYSYSVPGAVTGKRLRVARSGFYNPPTMSFDLNGSFTYDNEGRMTAEQYPNAGPNLSFGYDAMGRPYSVTDVGASQTIIGSASYGAGGQLVSMSGGLYFGSYGSESRSYNAMRQLTGISTGGRNLQYNYSATQNNGKIVSEKDLVSGEQVSYTYDTLNRLASASSNQNWSQSFAYDGFGNLTNVNGVNAPGLGVTYDPATNRVPSGCADANGNTFASWCGYGYTYDVENRMVSATTAGFSYSYAPGNKRVWRGSSSVDEVTYWSPSGQKLGTYAITTVIGNGQGQQSQFYCPAATTYYYFAGRMIKNGNGWIYPDRLGSTVKTYPYGVERPSATTNGTEKFTGYFRDAETGLDYADQRYEQPGMGRFLTADPYMANNGGAGDPANPGSWNRYAYTLGDPVNYHDPLGTEACPPDDPCAPPEDPGDPGVHGARCVVGCGVAAPRQQLPRPSGGRTTFAAAQAAFQSDAKAIANKTSFKPACDSDFAALGVTDDQVQAAASAAVFLNGIGSDVPLSSLYETSPVASVRQAGSTLTGTVGSAIVSPGTVALAQLGGNAIYINAPLINPGDYYQDISVVLHELLHNVTGLTDPDIQSALGLPSTDRNGKAVPSDNITQRLKKDCF
jgi:RHS repeat-associated protein